MEGDDVLTDARYALKQLEGIKTTPYLADARDRAQRAIDAIERIVEVAERSAAVPTES